MRSLRQFHDVLSFTSAFDTEEKCRKYLRKALWRDKLPCPHCGNLDGNYEFEGGVRFKCSECLKQFKVTHRTMFEGTHLPLRVWFVAIYLIAHHSKGLSSSQIAKYLGVTQKTAWFLAHRIRQAQQQEQLPFAKETVVEVDEAYFGGKAKGKRGRGAANKQAVLGMVERNGRIFVKPISDSSGEVLTKEVGEMVAEGARVITDSWRGYNALSETHQHDKIDHSKEFAKGDVHTNTIEGAWSLFKRAVFGVYHSISKKHFQRYCWEFAYRYNEKDAQPRQKFNLVVNGSVKKRLKYAELIA